MTSKNVYILHKNGANNHYIGLKYLVEQNGGSLVYREFSITGTLFKSIFRLDFGRAWKQVVNAFFLLGLLFSKNRKVVLGIAPFDYKLPFVLYFLKNHEVFYHTSWTVWDGSHHPKRKRVTPELMARWKKFLEEDARHIFAVSGETGKQLRASYAIADNRISVVYHSLNKNIFHPGDRKSGTGKLRFIYAGRLVEQKGIKELLDYFASCNDRELTIAGNGDLKEMVVEYSKKYPSIRYEGFVKKQSALADLYREHDYLVLNSKKTAKWEEVFGMVIIEAMACGTVPVSTNHTGPCEIITNNVNGYLVDEGTMPQYLADLDTSNYDAVRTAAIAGASLYFEENIAKRWQPVLD